MHLSICIAGGKAQPQTMELKGKLQGQEIVILIDSGASHNFIFGKVVKSLGPTGSNPTGLMMQD